MNRFHVLSNHKHQFLIPLALEFQFQEGLVCFWRLLRRASFCWALLCTHGSGIRHNGLMSLPRVALTMETEQERIKKGKMICCKHDTLQVWRVDGNCLGSAW